jgi:hypothetical protein
LDNPCLNRASPDCDSRINPARRASFPILTNIFLADAPDYS